MFEYLLTSTFIHLAILLSLWYTPVSLNTSGATKIEVNIVEKSKTPIQKTESPPILPNSPTVAKLLIPGERGAKPQKRPEVSIKDYADLLKSIVDPVWVSNLEPYKSQLNQIYEIIVLLSVNKSGTITNIRITKSSGVRALDQLAINTFKEIGSIPNPLEVIVKDGLEWTLTF